MNKRKESNRRIYAQLHSTKENIAEFDSFAPGNKELLSSIEPWSDLYLLPVEVVLVAFYQLAGMGEKLEEALSTDTPLESFLDFSENELPDHPEPENFEELMGTYIGIVQCLRYSNECLSRFHATPNQLLVKALRDQDFEPIYKAVFIDKTIASSRFMAYVMAECSIEQNGDFFNQLARSINGSRPYREDPEYDDLRFMLEANLLQKSRKNINSTELHEILVVDLELHPLGHEALDSLRKLIQKRNRIHRKLNAD